MLHFTSAFQSQIEIIRINSKLVVHGWRSLVVIFFSSSIHLILDAKIKCALPLCLNTSLNVIPKYWLPQLKIRNQIDSARSKNIRVRKEKKGVKETVKWREIALVALQTNIYSVKHYIIDESKCNRNLIEIPRKNSICKYERNIFGKCQRKKNKFQIKEEKEENLEAQAKGFDDIYECQKMRGVHEFKYAAKKITNRSKNVFTFFHNLFTYFFSSQKSY